MYLPPLCLFCVYSLRRAIEPTPHAGASRPSPSFLSSGLPRHASRATLFLPSPSESDPPSHRNKNQGTGSQEVIYITSSSDSPPPQRSARSSKKRTRQPTVQLLTCTSLPAFATRAIRRSSSGSAQASVNPQRKVGWECGKAHVIRTYTVQRRNGAIDMGKELAHSLPVF